MITRHSATTRELLEKIYRHRRNGAERIPLGEIDTEANLSTRRTIQELVALADDGIVDLQTDPATRPAIVVVEPRSQLLDSEHLDDEQ